MTQKPKWTAKEDQELTESVKRHGTGNWSLVALSITGRNGKQCRERWINQISPDLKKDDWTAEEDEILVQGQQTFGNNWAVICQYLAGRSSNNVKNRWSLICRQKSSTVPPPPPVPQPTVPYVIPLPMYPPLIIGPFPPPQMLTFPPAYDGQFGWGCGFLYHSPPFVDPLTSTVIPPKVPVPPATVLVPDSISGPDRFLPYPGPDNASYHHRPS
jgi:hypothetical protein